GIGRQLDDATAQQASPLRWFSPDRLDGAGPCAKPPHIRLPTEKGGYTHGIATRLVGFSSVQPHFSPGQGLQRGGRRQCQDWFSSVARQVSQPHSLSEGLPNSW